jgi:hypothetical protein
LLEEKGNGVKKDDKRFKDDLDSYYLWLFFARQLDLMPLKQFEVVDLIQRSDDDLASHSYCFL